MILTINMYTIAFDLDFDVTPIAIQETLLMSFAIQAFCVKILNFLFCVGSRRDLCVGTGFQ